jgi:hypothetical protein
MFNQDAKQCLTLYYGEKAWILTKFWASIQDFLGWLALFLFFSINFMEGLFDFDKDFEFRKTGN